MQEENLWKIHGKYYDFSSYLDKHPGGRDLLYGARGISDSTPAFESYHAFKNIKSIKRMIQKFEYKGEVITRKRKLRPIRPYTFEEDGFYKTLIRNIKSAYPKEKFKDTAFFHIRNVSLLIISFIFLYLSSYYTLASIGFGFFSGIFGFNVWHDIEHGVFKTRYSKPLRHLITFLGSNFDIDTWNLHHNIKHHTYTGAKGYDPDEDTWNIKGFFQPLFAQFAQCLFYISFYIRNHLWYIEKPKDLKMSIMVIANTISLYPLLYYISGTIYSVPLAIFGKSFGYMVLVYADHFMKETMELTEKLYEEKEKPIDWGETQVLTSGDFCVGNLFFDYFSGGMSYQIEHHLFPSMCNVHYKKIAPIVKLTCDQFNIKYNNHYSFSQIFSEMFNRFFIGK